MKRSLFLFIVSFLFMGSIHAEDHWTPAPPENGDASIHIYAQVKINGQLQSSGDVEVAMFFDDECVHTTRVKSMYSGNFVGVKLSRTYCSTVDCVYNGTPCNYQVTFKCYDHDSQTEYDECPTTYTATGGIFTISPTENLVLEFNTCFKKEILSYNGNGGYYFIASPVGQVDPEAVTGMLDNEYDLYYFDESQTLEWINYEDPNEGGFGLVAGKGYLYANSQDVTLKFFGNAYSGSAEVTLTKTEGAILSGWNLVGNPFAETAYIDRYFYTLNATHSEIITEPITGGIPAMEGVFVKANSHGEHMTFTTTAPSTQSKGVSINLSQGGGATSGSPIIDRVIVDFNEGTQLPKLMLDNHHTKLSVAQDDDEFAVVRSDGRDVMPLNFKASENGTYTLSVEVENTEMAFLHLIDNLTHTDIDLLQTPSYTFEANVTDPESRFVLVFAVQQIQEPGCPWIVDPYSTTGNASLFAIVQINGVTITEGSNWVVGAFCGDECRGLGGPTHGWIYINQSGIPYTCYMVFNVNGNAGDQITFKLYDVEAGDIYPNVCEVTLTYQDNAVWGDFWNPQILDFTTPSYSKHILPYTEDGGYYLIASPIGQVAPGEVIGMLDNNYDLYYFDQEEPNELEWINYKDANEGDYDLMPGKGYLYANSEDIFLVFTGLPAYPTTIDVPVQLVKRAGARLEGWNLVGNPYAVTAYIDRPFYTMQEGGAEIMAETSTGPIEAMEGVFVLAAEDNEYLTFTTTQPENNGKGLFLDLSQDRGASTGSATIDRAIIRFGDEKSLPKFQLNRDNTKLYIPQDGMDYALVNAETQGEMPVNFVAAEDGAYTISVVADGTEMNYLHLIDNMTGADVDLLVSPSYSFEAKTTDAANRFKLVFAAGASTDSETFAFFSNGSFVISNDGPATLQMVDVTGRILSNEQINGSCSKSFDAAAGVFLLRLVNGDSVKVQKVVVE